MMAEESANETSVNGVNGIHLLASGGETKVKDIEDAILDQDMQRRKLEKILEKRKWVSFSDKDSCIL